jgi:tRNA-2-methylthio-N6-dimethylallyladenosine synthase
MKAEAQVGQVQLVLVDGVSKRNAEELSGRNEANKPVIFKHSIDGSPIEIGDYVAVRIDGANQLSFRGTPLYKTSLSRFYGEI